MENEVEINEQISAETLDNITEHFAMELDMLDPTEQGWKEITERSGLTPDSLCGAIETVLFMSDRPVSLNKIKIVIDEQIPLKIYHECLERLQNEYESSHHGLRLVEVAEGYQYRTKATYSKYVQDLFKVNSLVLSPTSLEVLAIIAYKQPVSRIEVDRIRGVDSSHIVRLLMDKRLVKVTGRSDEVGRPTLFGTTPEFMEVFNLSDLGALPPEHELKALAETNFGKISDIRGLVNTGDKKQFIFDEIDELDQLSESIKSIPSDTDFTSQLASVDKKRNNEDGTVKKTAFELLEEFVAKQVLLKQNQLAAISELPMTTATAKVVEDLENPNLNAPLSDEEFQMIDLNTGLPLSEETEEELFPEADLEDEKALLAKELDDAFERLTGESLQDENEVVFNEDEIAAMEKKLDVDFDAIFSEEK
jgi:segregation and condensation protein B